MSGYTRKRGDAWELRVYVGVDAVTGKMRYATTNVRGGKRDAEREASSADRNVVQQFADRLRVQLIRPVFHSQYILPIS
jgi:hypothetical protein